MDRLIRRIVENEEIELEEAIFVDKLQEPVLGCLMQSLKSNTRLRKLSLSRYSGPEWRQHDQKDHIRKLFQAIRSLPSLCAVRLAGFDGQETGLREFLYHHPTLERLEINSAAFDTTLMHTIQSIPNLKDVSFCLGMSMSLAAIMEVQTLERFELIDFESNFSDFHLIEILKGASMSGSLRSLYFGVVRSGAVVDAIARMLQRNQVLLSVEVDFQGKCQREIDSFCFQIAAALETNRSLETFVLYPINMLPSRLGKGGRNAVLKMLEKNYTLRQLDLMFDENADTDGNDPMEEESLSPALETDEFILKKDIFLKMNSLGRDRLLTRHNVPTRAWVEMMIGVQDDLDGLFYLISTNPSLCAEGRTTY